MQFIRTVLAAMCAALFVITSVIVLLLINIERKAFSAATYKQAFADQGLYQRMPEILGGTLSAYIAENGSAVPFLQILTIEDWQSSIVLLLPPEELKQMGDQALEATFDYLNGKTDSATLSLVPVKTRLAGDAGTQMVLQILRRQPACTPDQLQQMAVGLFGGQIVLCNPPDEAVNLMMPFIQTEVQAMVALFPNEVTFIPGTLSGTPADPRRELNTLRSAIKLTPILPALLLIGILLFAVRSLVDWLTWWGWPLMVAGGASVLLALFGSPIVAAVLRLVIQTQGVIFIPPALAATIAETAGAVAHQILNPLVIAGFIFGFVGLGMVILALFLAKRARDEMIRRLNTNITP